MRDAIICPHCRQDILLSLNATAGRSRPSFHATRTEKLLLHAIYEAMADNPLPPPAGLPGEIAQVAHYQHVYDLMQARFVADKDDQEKAGVRFRQAFRRAVNVLHDCSIIGIQGKLLWPTGKPVNGFSPKIDGGDF